MKNNLMLFLTVFFLSVGISKADVFEEMFEELTKGTKNSEKPDSGDSGKGGIGTCIKGSDNCLDGKSSRSKEEIMQVVNENMPALRSLYREYLKQKPGFSGEVVLKFTVAASGKIIDIKIVSSTTGYVNFDKAIKNKVATWKWEAIKSGNTTPTIPFKFTDDSWDI